jgi:adenosylcobinamide kinase/adenosylcobinamide-phosphate guanylyltransferase
VSQTSAFRRTLVLGGARSGKSRFAEQLAADYGAPVVYVATAESGDDEMAHRIAHHQASRPATWRTVEARFDLARSVTEQQRDAHTVLVEDLTILLSNLTFREAPVDVEVDSATMGQAESAARIEVDGLLALDAHIVLVSNEVGMGVVPAFPLGRLFRDALGRLNQYAAARADEAYLLVAGLPLRLKPSQLM